MTEIKKVVTSKRFRINLRDAGRGLIVAMLSAGIAVVQTAFDQHTLVFNWKLVVGAALSGGFGYIIKNFFEPSKVIFETKEVEEK